MASSNFPFPEGNSINRPLVFNDKDFNVCLFLLMIVNFWLSFDACCLIEFWLSLMIIFESYVDCLWLIAFYDFFLLSLMIILESYVDCLWWLLLMIVFYWVLIVLDDCLWDLCWLLITFDDCFWLLYILIIYTAYVFLWVHKRLFNIIWFSYIQTSGNIFFWAKKWYFEQYGMLYSFNLL